MFVFRLCQLEELVEFDLKGSPTRHGQRTFAIAVFWVFDDEVIADPVHQLAERVEHDGVERIQLSRLKQLQDIAVVVERQAGTWNRFSTRRSPLSASITTGFGADKAKVDLATPGWP